MGTGLTVITVINAGGHTSMPLNEFVLFRHIREMDSKHVVVALQGGEWVGCLQRRNIEVLVANGRELEVSRMVLRLARQLRPNAVVHCHHPRTAFPVLLALALGRAGIRTVFTVHSMYQRYSPLTRILSIASVLLADYVTFVSRASWSSYPLLIRRLKARRCSVIENGVDVDSVLLALQGAQSGPAATYREDEDAIRLISVARMIPEKNLELLIRVIRAIPRARLTLVGDGPERRRLERLAEDLGVDHRVRFTGLTPRQRVYAEMAQSDVFLTASRYEGLPVALLEAMAVGLPILASDIAPHREVLSGIPGAVIVPNQLEAWVSAVESLRQLGREELRARGLQNRHVVMQRFSLQAMHEGYTAVYRGLTHEPGLRRKHISVTDRAKWSTEDGPGT